MARNRLLYLNPNDWVLISARAERRKFQLGEVIIQEGSLVNSIYIIRHGEAEVALASTSKREVVAMLGPDDVCGDMAFLERTQASAAVVTKSVELEADEVKFEDLRDLFESFPRLASRFYQSLAVVLARRLRDTSKELAREKAISDGKD